MRTRRGVGLRALVALFALLTWAALSAVAGAEGPPPARPYRLAVPGLARSEPPRPVRLVATGDLMLGRSIGERIVAGRGDTVFAGVQPLLRGADITVGNLECVITGSGEPQPKAYTFAAPVAAAGVLQAAGFDVVALANNHALDYGVAGLSTTIDALRARGIGWTGAGADAREAGRPYVLERSGIRFAFLSFVEVPLEYGGFDTRAWEAGDGRPGVAWLDVPAMTRAIAAARESAEIVVVLLHFGFEGEPQPSAMQVEQARAAIDAGAALVIGTHPHVLQPVEEYHGGLIAYSLGNFVFDYEESEAPSAVLSVDFQREGVVSWRLVPAVVSSDGLPLLAR